MKTKLIHIIGFVALALTIGGVRPAGAVFAVLDARRGMQFVLESLERTNQMMENINKNMVTKEQIELWKNKIALKKPTTAAYDYAVDVDIASLPSGKIAPPQADLDTAIKFVKKTFFVPSKEEEVTEALKAEVMNARKDYVLSLGKEIISYGTGVKDASAEDLKAAPEISSNAGGILQEIELNTEIIKALVLTTTVNILLEARLLEMEAANMLLTQKENLVEKPVNEGGEA